MKKFLSMLLAVAMILSLAACGKDDAEVEVSEPHTNNEVVVEHEPSMPVIKGDEDRIPVDDSCGSSSSDGIEDGSGLGDGLGDVSEPPTGDDSGAASEPHVSEDQPPIIEPSQTAESDDEEPIEEEPNKWLNEESGEKAISSGKFDGGIASEDAIREMLHVSGAQVSSEVVTCAVTMLNTYSKEGFIRYIEDKDSARDMITQSASVLVCRILGMKYEQLWESGFMEQPIVETIVEVLDNAEKEWKEGDKK